MNYTEKKGKAPTDIDYLMQTVAMLTDAVKTQNDVILVLANKLNIEADIPHWQTKEDVEKAVGPKVQACIEAIGKIYGHSETD